MKPRVARINTPLNGLLLGWNEQPGTDKITPIWDTNREGHLITVAPTGSGKGVSCAIPALLSWSGPCIVVDPKGENYAVTSERRRSMGHLVHRLDPFGVAGDDLGDSLNPMDLIDPNAPDFEDNAAVVARLCMQDHATLSDPFWDERATAMIVAVICELFRILPSRRPTLQDVQDGIKGAPIYDEDPEAVKRLMNRFAPDAPPPKPNPLSVSRVITSSQFSSDKTRSSIMATASAHMGFLRSPAVHASLSNSTITLDDITAGAMHTIYLILPPDKLVTHGKLLRLWIGVMLAAISRRRRAPQQPTLFLIDEAAQLGAMIELLTALTLMRSYGVRVWTFWQDLSQLKAIYPKDWESIINNSGVHQYFGAKSPPAKAALKKFLTGEYPVDGIGNEHQLLFNGETITTTRRPNYLVDPVFAGLASPHPFHTPQKQLELQ